MSTGHSAPSFAKDPLATIAGLLRQLTMAALHVQVRARFQGDLPQILAGGAGVMAHAAVDGQASLRATSRYCLEQLLPRVQSVMTHVEDAAGLVATLAEAPRADPAPLLNSIAANLDHARGSLRGRSRSPHNRAGVIRLSEQRLWGALAVELQRLEGADGPMIRACARIEPAAFALDAAIEAFLERGDGMAVAQRHDLTQVLVRLESQAAATLLSRDEIARQLGPTAGRLQHLVGLLAGLSEEYRPLREAAPQIAMTLSIATQTASQSRVTQRLEQAMQDLERLLSGLVADYRGLARSAQRPQGKAAARQLIAAEAPLWQAAAKVLVDPPALVPDSPAACPAARIGGRTGGDVRAMVRA